MRERERSFVLSTKVIEGERMNASCVFKRGMLTGAKEGYFCQSNECDSINIIRYSGGHLNFI